MATDDPIRASDVDREAVASVLREAYTAGRLTLEEFDERVSATFASKTWGDLRKVTVDLPSQPVLGTDVPGRHLPRAGALPNHPPRPQPRPLPEPVAEQEQPASEEPSRRRPVAILIPVAVWTLLVMHSAVGAGLVFVLIAVFAVASIMASIRRR